jgi:hypothetical protein
MTTAGPPDERAAPPWLVGTGRQEGGLQPHPVEQPSVPRIGVLAIQTPFVELRRS